MFTAKDQGRLAQLLKRKQGSSGEDVESKRVNRKGAGSGDGCEWKSGDGVKDQNGRDSKPQKKGRSSIPVSLESKRKNLTVSLERKRKNLTVSLESKSKNLTETARNRLAFSRFRSINEYLYSNPSSDVVGYMDEDTFKSYHSAYSILASKWPVKPIDAIIEWMDKLYPNSGKGQVLADMGCGEKPMIAEHFLNASVHSFDLYSTDERITKSSVTSVPVEGNSCHCVVYSLSLMNTDVGDVMKEAARILKHSGHLIIAEVASRFQSHNAGKGKTVQRKGESGESDPKDDSHCDSVTSFSRKLMKHFNLKLKRIEYLKPNDYFVIMDFVKVKRIESEGEKKLIAKIPEIKLNPCLYKPR